MKWTKLIKAEKYPKIVKEGNIYHVLYAEGTKSKQFKSKEEAEKYCKSIKSGIVPTKDITLDNGKKYTVRYNPSNKSILAIFENGKEIGVDAGTRLQLLRKLFHKDNPIIVEEKTKASKIINHEDQIDFLNEFYSKNKYGDLFYFDDVQCIYKPTQEVIPGAELEQEYSKIENAIKNFMKQKEKTKASYGGYSAFDGTEEQQLFDLMIEHGIITEDEFELVTDGWGYNLETAETVLYVRTSLRSLEQLKSDLGIEDDSEEENDEEMGAK